MRSEVIEITPKMAKEFLAKNTSNRNKSADLVRRYALDMKNGKWSTTHQGIGVFKDGVLADGQHRLEAIIFSGCTVPMMVTFDIERECGTDIDQHRQRKTHDAIKIGGLSDWVGKDEVALIRHLSPWKILSIHKIVEVAESIKDGLEFVRDNFSSKRRGITHAAVRVAVVKAYYATNEKARLGTFCKTLITGEQFDVSDIAAIRLREYLLENQMASHSGTVRSETTMRAERAIKAFLDKERISKLFKPKDFIYPIPEWLDFDDEKPA
jgi:hypothetical protein